MADLKPCSHCGGKPMLGKPTCTKKSKYNPLDRAYPIVWCLGCRAEVAGDDWDEIGLSAVTAWNHRPLEATKDATIERMRGLLREALPLLRDYGGGYVVFGNRQTAVREVAIRIDAELKEGE